MHTWLYVGLMVAAALTFTIGGVFTKPAQAHADLPDAGDARALRDRGDPADAVDRGAGGRDLHISPPWAWQLSRSPSV